MGGMPVVQPKTADMSPLVELQWSNPQYKSSIFMV